MGTKEQPAKFDCYKNALPDEPMFVLLARDFDAPRIIEEWARRRLWEIENHTKPESDREKVLEAEQCAMNMRKWRKENDGIWRK